MSKNKQTKHKDSQKQHTKIEKPVFATSPQPAQDVKITNMPELPELPEKVYQSTDEESKEIKDIVKSVDKPNTMEKIKVQKFPEVPEPVKPPEPAPVPVEKVIKDKPKVKKYKIIYCSKQDLETTLDEIVSSSTEPSHYSYGYYPPKVRHIKPMPDGEIMIILRSTENY